MRDAYDAYQAGLTKHLGATMMKELKLLVVHRMLELGLDADDEDEEALNPMSNLGKVTKQLDELRAQI